MIVSELLTELGFTFDEKGLKKAKHGLADIEHALVEIATVVASWAVVHELTEVVNETTNAAFEMAKVAETFGITTQAFEAMQYAAGQVGVEISEVHIGLSRLAMGAQEAAEGSAEAQKKFTALGLHLKDAQGNLRPVNELFLEAADKIKAIDNPTKQAGLAMQIFGRSGTRLLPLLKKGSEGIEAYEADIKHLGAEMSGPFIADSKRYRAEQQRHKLALEGLHMAVTKAVLPAFIKLEHWLAEGLGWINRAVAGTHFLEVAFASLGVVMGVLAIKAALPFLPYIGMAALVVLATLAVIVVIEDFIAWISGQDSAIGRLIARWESWADTFADSTKWDWKNHPFMTFLEETVRLLRIVEGFTKRLFAEGPLGVLKHDASANLQKSMVPGADLGAQAVGQDQDFWHSLATHFMGNRPTFYANPMVAGAGNTMAVPGPWAAPSSTVSSAPTFNMTINSGSADPSAVAAEARRQVDAALESHAQDLHSALVPGLAPLGSPD